MVLRLEARDEAALGGSAGPAAQWAMRVLVRAAEAVGAARLIDVSQAHLVGSYHSGPGNLLLMERLAASGAQVVIPTTLNACAADLERPRPGSESDADFQGNCAVVGIYQRLGCQVELTCAPYQLPRRPLRGENIAWAESNAVVFANSVIGARTNTTWQFLDLAAALTGRMPEYGLYLEEARAGRVLFELDTIPAHWFEDDAFSQLLGYLIGRLAGTEVPVIANPPRLGEDALRGLGAAAASAGQVAMFHAVGLTPEAPTLRAALHDQDPLRVIRLGPRDFLKARRELCRHSGSTPLAAVCLGAPHYSMTEFENLVAALAGRRVSPETRLVVSTSRYNRRELARKGVLELLLASGVEVVADTCTYYGRQLGLRAGLVMTASAKWAVYAPGNLGLEVLFARLADCVESAVLGRVVSDEAFWSC